MPIESTPVERPDHLELIALLNNLAGQVDIVDIGAHGTPSFEVYTPLLSGKASVIGFEPNPNECTRLNLKANRSRRFEPFAIADGGQHTFHICRSPLTSSLLRPNRPLLVRYENLSELCEVVALEQIATVRLDDVVGIERIDFLKIDVQGATLSVLQGAPRLLANTLVIHSEVEFSPIYEGEALFSECEQYLRTRGYMFHHFHQIEGRRVRAGDRFVGVKASQQLWADAVFVPDHARLDTLSANALARFALIMHLIYDACDFTMSCLARIDKALGTSYSDTYVALLNRHGILS
jgi:FkbM family methyltransferase